MRGDSAHFNSPRPICYDIHKLNILIFGYSLSLYRRTQLMQNNLREEIYRLHAEVCGALADPNRILLLYMLSAGPHRVNDLVTNSNLPQPTASRHLNLLRDRGMVTACRSGHSITYELTDMRVIQALDLLRAALADRLDTQAALAQTMSGDST